MELDKKTCLVRVDAGGGRAGQLGFERGTLMYAGTGARGEGGAAPRSGDAAVTEMCGWREPRLRVSPGLPSPSRNVHTPLATLLLESARTLDESAALAG